MTIGAFALRHFSAAQAVASISLSNASFTGGTGSGTGIGVITVTMTYGTFVGSLSLTGADHGSFQLSGTSLQTNGVVPGGTYSINIVATPAGGGVAPFSQPETINGSGTNVESPAGTVVTTAGPIIYTSSTPGSPGAQNAIAIVGTPGTPSGQVSVNGTIIAVTANVVNISEIDHCAFQFNGTNYYGPISAGNAGTQLSGSPLPTLSLSASSLAANSASGTIIGVLSTTTGLNNGTIGTGAYTWAYSLSGSGFSNFQVVGGNLESAVPNVAGGAYNLTVSAAPTPTILGGPFTLPITVSVGSAQSTTIPIYATPPSLGTTYYVDGVNGSDSNNGLAAGSGHAWKTLQHAASSIAGGSTVLVYNGTYTNSSGAVISITGLNGSATSWTVFKAAPGQSPVIQDSTGNNSYACNNITSSSYICFAGFTVTGTNQSLSQSGAFADNAGGGSGHYNTNGFAFGNQSGSLNSHHIQVLNCNISNFPQNGINTSYCDYITTQGNTIFNNAYYSAFQASGISIFDLVNFDAVAGNHVLINGNIVYGNQCFVGSGGTSATGVTDGEGIIIDLPGTGGWTAHGQITNNICYGNGSMGIETIHTSNNWTIAFNTCYRNVITPPADLAFAPNIMEVSYENATNILIYNNIIVASGSNTGGYIYDTGTTTGSVVDHNLLFGGNANASGSNIGTNAIQADPSFASTTTFALNSGSPAKNAATASFSVATDIYGNTRPGGTANTLGAVQ